MTAPVDWSDTPGNPGNTLNATRLNARDTLINGKQPLDADLTALAAMTAPATQLSNATAALPSTPRFLLYSSGWPDRPDDDRLTIFVGGDSDTDEPTDIHLRTYDVWWPAT